MISAVKPGAARPDLFKPYVYRGTGVDVLTAFMDDECYCDGSSAAYWRHRRYGEEPCEKSKASNAERRAAYWLRRKARS